MCVDFLGSISSETSMDSSFIPHNISARTLIHSQRRIFPTGADWSHGESTDEMMKIALGKPPPPAKDQLSHGESTEEMMKTASGRQPLPVEHERSHSNSTERMLKAARGHSANARLKPADDSTPMDITLSESEDGKLQAVTKNLTAFCNLSKIRRDEIELSSSEGSSYSDAPLETDGEVHPAPEMNDGFSLDLEEHGLPLNSLGKFHFLFCCLGQAHF